MNSDTFRRLYLGMWIAVGVTVTVLIVGTFSEYLPVFGSQDRGVEVTYTTCKQKLRKQRIRAAIAQSVCECLSANIATLENFDPEDYSYLPDDLTADLSGYCTVAIDKLDAFVFRKELRAEELDSYRDN